MSNITETIPINNADIVLRERLIKQGLINSINKEKELFELTEKRLFALREKVLRRKELYEDFIRLQLEIIGDRLKNAYYLFEIKRKTPANYYLYLVLQKISQLEKSLGKYFSLKAINFVACRTGFFFSFKENKKNTP